MSADDVALAKLLYARINEQLTGVSVTSVSGSGRSVSYANVSVGDLINYYRQVRARLSAEAIAANNLPDVAPLTASNGAGDRRPAYYTSRGCV